MEWKGDGVDEIGINKENGKSIIKINPRYFRPTEVDLLLGDPSNAKEKLGWEAKIRFTERAKLMTKSDFELLQSGKEILF